MWWRASAPSSAPAASSAASSSSASARARIAAPATQRASEAASDGSSSDSGIAQDVRLSELCVGATLLKKERSFRVYVEPACANAKILVHYVDSDSLATGKMPLAPIGHFVSLPEGFVLAEYKPVPPAEESGCMVWAHVELLGSKPHGEGTAELPGPGGVHQVKASGAGVEVITPQGKRIRVLEELALHLFEEGTRNLEEAMKAVRRRKLEGGEGEKQEESRGEAPAREEADESRVEEGGDATEGEEMEESRQDDALTTSYDGEDGDSEDEAGNGGVEDGAEMIAGEKRVKNEDKMMTGDPPLETELEASREDDAEMSTDDGDETEEDAGENAGGGDDGEGDGEDNGEDDEEGDGEDDEEGDAEGDGEDDEEGDGEDDEEGDAEGDGEAAASQAFVVPNPEERLEASIEEELIKLNDEDEAKLNELDGCFELPSHSYNEPVVLVTKCEGFDKLERTVLGLHIVCSNQQRLASEQTNFNAKVEEYNRFHDTQKRKRSTLLEKAAGEENQLTKRLKLAKRVYNAHAGFLKSLPENSDDMFDSLPLKAAQEFDDKFYRCDIMPTESRIDRLKAIEKKAIAYETHRAEKLATLSTKATRRWEEQEAAQASVAEEGVVNLPCVINAYIGKSIEQHAATEKLVALQKEKLNRAEEAYLGYDTKLAKTTIKNAKDDLLESEHHLEAVVQRDQQVCDKLNGLKSALEEMVRSLNDDSRRLFDERVQEGHHSRGSLNVNTQIKEIIEFLDELNKIAPPPPRHTNRMWRFTSFLTGA